MYPLLLSQDFLLFSVIKRFCGKLDFLDSISYKNYLRKELKTKLRVKSMKAK